MKIVAINTMTVGSTGRIMLQISHCARKHGMEVTTFSTNYSGKHYKKLPPAPEGHRYFSTWAENYAHLALGMVTGYQGCFGHFNTARLINAIDHIKPDVIHLHNIHSTYINLDMLFSYIKKKKIKVVWTLHDCWSFTGQCPHFVIAKCDKWKTGCHDCTQYKKYPKSYVDRTKAMWKLKKKWFTMPEEMVLVTPSQWLADLTRQSYLSKYPCKVINNGVDLSIFKPTDSDFRKKYGLENKYIILGVSFAWGYRKGLDIFIELSKRLNSDYKIVLVGTDDIIDKQLPDNILSIHKTNSQQELAEIYSTADVFFNPTREEVLGMVNLEAIACGTPVVTFNTGGSPETIDPTCGYVIDSENIENIQSKLEWVCTEKPYSVQACVDYAKRYDMNDKFEEYVSLYKELE